MAKQRHRLESSSSDGSVTRSKHKIGVLEDDIHGTIQCTAVLRLPLSVCCTPQSASDTGGRNKTTSSTALGCCNPCSYYLAKLTWRFNREDCSSLGCCSIRRSCRNDKGIVTRVESGDVQFIWCST